MGPTGAQIRDCALSATAPAYSIPHCRRVNLKRLGFKGRGFKSLSPHAGCAMSGLIADSRTMVDRARVQAQHHWFTYNEPMSVESVTQSVSNLAMSFGKDSEDEKHMVNLDPSVIMYMCG